MLQVKLVGDGAEYPFSVELAPGQHFTGTVRPAAPAELGRYRHDLRAAADDPDKFEATRAAFYAKHIKSWNLVGEDGKPLPVTAATVARLPASLFDRLGDVAAGDGGVDLLGNSPA